MKQIINKYRKNLIVLCASIFIILGFSTIAPSVAVAIDLNYLSSIKSSTCEGLEFTGGSCDSANTPSNQTSKSKINSIIKTVINIFSLIVGFVSVLMIMVGGFKYVTSTGDSGNITSAKNTILYAIIGLVIVALAQIIVQFVLGKV